MKILSAVVFFLVILFSSQSSFAQDSSRNSILIPATLNAGYNDSLEGHLSESKMYTPEGRMMQSADSIKASLAWSAKMHDTVILLNPEFRRQRMYTLKGILWMQLRIRSLLKEMHQGFLKCHRNGSNACCGYAGYDHCVGSFFRYPRIYMREKIHCRQSGIPLRALLVQAPRCRILSLRWILHLWSRINITNQR